MIGAFNYLSKNYQSEMDASGEGFMNERDSAMCIWRAVDVYVQRHATHLGYTYPPKKLLQSI